MASPGKLLLIRSLFPFLSLYPAPVFSQIISRSHFDPVSSEQRWHGSSGMIFLGNVTWQSNSEPVHTGKSHVGHWQLTLEGSGSPSGRRYELSVLRDSRKSIYLHFDLPGSLYIRPPKSILYFECINTVILLSVLSLREFKASTLLMTNNLQLFISVPAGAFPDNGMTQVSNGDSMSTISQSNNQSLCKKGQIYAATWKEKAKRSLKFLSFTVGNEAWVRWLKL